MKAGEHDRAIAFFRDSLAHKDAPPKNHLSLAAAFVAKGDDAAACFHLGLFFSFAMVALMSGYILYESSMILKHFPTNHPVAAAVMLFSTVATLFMWILRILMELSRDR